MKLYFLRHGLADWPDWTQPDDERPLTKKGRKQVRRMTKFLRQLEVAPALVLSSPLPRAWQTAEIAAAILDVELRPACELGKGFDLAGLRQILTRHQGEDLMLVGHEPDFSAVVASLTGGEVKLAKGGLARVDLAEGSEEGRLVWLLPPKIAQSK